MKLDVYIDYYITSFTVCKWNPAKYSCETTNINNKDNSTNFKLFNYSFYRW